jgi:excisionase family DNA binding protein
MEEAMATKLTYTVPEAAELLGISRSSAYECVRRGELPALVLGRRIVVPKHALAGLLGGPPAAEERSEGGGVR